MHIIVGVSPYDCCAEAKELRDPQGISSSNIIVLITDHSHTFLFGDPEGSPSKIVIKVYHVKSMSSSEHMIISFLLWHFMA